jgi:hypothetical protein
MADVEKQNEVLEEEGPATEQEIAVEVEKPSEEAVNEETETTTPQEEFYANLAEDLDDRVLGRLASKLVDDYRKDKISRKDWETGYTQGLDLLGFKYTEMTRPFRGAANVTHPLLAEAVTQFQAQAYKELLPSDGPVRCKVLGDETQEKQQQADRVQDFMNYMLMEKMEEYTPEFDQLLFYLPLAGSAFKKIYYDAIMERAVSKFVPAEDLVVPYYATDLMDCERITHLVKMSENEVLKKQKTGFYRDIELKPVQTGTSDIKKKYDQLEGIVPTADIQTNFNILEMHVDLNLEEFETQNPEKEVKIPYIVTVDEGSSQVLSIYRNYEPDDPTHRRKEYFIHYKFLPGLGFYGFGLIHMIGGLSRTATTALRQLLDAGTLSNLPAGFKSRGIRIRDDDQPFQPGEFRDVDAPGGNIKDQFQMLPFKEPSVTLFNLMGFVVNAGQRFASITDMATGSDVQNRAVGTTVALLERGSRVMTAIHKRCYYAMRNEFRLVAKVFGTFLPPVYPYAVYGADRIIKSQDFDERVDVIPVADPNIYSLSQRVTLASENLKIAQSNPQMHNLREAYRRIYEALGTRDIDKVLKPEPPVVPKDPAIENMEALQMKLPKAFPEQDHQAHISSHTTFMATRMVQVNPMVYALLQGHVSEHVSLLAQGEVGAMIQNSPEMQQMLSEDPEGAEIKVAGMIAQKCAEITAELVQKEQMGKQKDPLVALKERELDLKAMDMQRKATESSQDMEMTDSQFEEKTDVDKMKLEEDEDQARERIRIADEKIDQAAVLAREKMDMTRDIAGAKLGVEKMKRTAENKRTKEMGKKK